MRLPYRLCQLAKSAVYMHVLDVAVAVATCSHREQQSGTEQVGYLDTRVVLAVAKHRHFQDSWVPVARHFELLRKDRMRDPCIGGGVTAICEHDPRVACAFQEVLKVRADVLDRERVDRTVVTRSPNRA